MPDADPKAWMKIADSDLALARVVLDSDPTEFSNGICYHCQQAAEKYLKALVVASQKAYPRTHDLVELVRILTAFYPEIGILTADSAWLTDAGGQARYPNVEEPCDENDSRRALAIAERIKQFCLEHVKG